LGHPTWVVGTLSTLDGRRLDIEGQLDIGGPRNTQEKDCFGTRVPVEGVGRREEERQPEGVACCRRKPLPENAPPPLRERSLWPTKAIPTHRSI